MLVYLHFDFNLMHTFTIIDRTFMIRLANTGDIRILNDLVNRAYRGDVSRKGWTTEADLLDGKRIVPDKLAELVNSPDSVILVYTDGQETIRGCVNLQHQGKQLYLGLFSVDPDFQSQGIGKQLLSAATDYARAHHFESIVMSVISVRSELIAWYQKYGYTDTGKKAPFPPAHPDSGIPKQDLEFIILEKKLNHA